MDVALCECCIDYSTVEGERILPFIISLNEENSNLYPAPGEYQTFCYDVIGTGLDTSKYVDLSHFLFEICEKIDQADIVDVLVTINGKNGRYFGDRMWKLRLQRNRIHLQRE